MHTEPLPRRSASLADDIVRQVDELIVQSVRDNQPLEVDPARARLFELFVTAEGAGYFAADADADLTADAVCKRLAAGWGLDAVAQESVARQAKLPAEQLAMMRGLWSFLRMWMEWTYAWERWQEFHN